MGADVKLGIFGQALCCRKCNEKAPFDFQKR
jgi:hypothetical protein